MCKKILLAIALTVSCAAAANAGVTYNFDMITNNTPAHAAVGLNQLFVDVDSFGSNQLLFTFRNTGPEASSITAVYFKGLDSQIASLVDANEGVGGDPGVDFSIEDKQSQFPGGGWKSDIGLSSKADSPVAPNGVNPGESLGVIFNLQSGQSLDSIVDKMLSQQILIGIHVQAFADGNSDSFVNNTFITPAPAAIALGSLGVILVGCLRRKMTL